MSRHLHVEVGILTREPGIKGNTAEVAPPGGMDPCEVVVIPHPAALFPALRVQIGVVCRPEPVDLVHAGLQLILPPEGNGNLAREGMGVEAAPCFRPGGEKEAIVAAAKVLVPVVGIVAVPVTRHEVLRIMV